MYNIYLIKKDDFNQSGLSRKIDLKGNIVECMFYIKFLKQ